MTDTYAEMLIPDTIEPVYGWKALKILIDGRLASPQQKTIWPVKQRLEASCTKKHTEYRWTAVGGKQEPHPYSEDGPVTVLPAGLSWSWEPVPHQIASNNCTCGIYVVNNVKKAATYLGADCILAEICLWGRVVPGTEGARGQYAYPRQLFAPDKLADVATMVAQLYQIPIGYREHRTGKTLTYEEAINNLEQMKAEIAEAKKPKPFVQNPPTQIPNVIVPNSPAEIPQIPAREPVTYQITTSSNTSVDTDDNNVETNTVDRAISRFLALLSTVMIVVLWLGAILIHPGVLIGALPFMLLLPISAHNGWTKR